MVRRTLVDPGSSIDIIILECPKKLQYTVKNLKVEEVPIVWFTGHTTYPLEIKKLFARVKEKDNARTID